MANVRETWAEELGGFKDQPECIGYALKSLADSPYPPTLPEFIAACRKAPRKEAPALPYKPTAEDHERMAAAARKAKRAVEKAGSDKVAHWATHPRSHQHLQMIFDAAKSDARFCEHVESLVASGVCTAEGGLLRVYHDGAWEA
ncbi:MAG: hypothetical protein ACKO0Z_05225, partial [Betaproteobacteria bacterium]